MLYYKSFKILHMKPKGYGVRIKAARLEMDLTQEGLGRLCGVTKQAVGKWEKDETEPTASNIVSVAKYLEKTPEYFMTGQESLENRALDKTLFIEVIEFALDNNEFKKSKLGHDALARIILHTYYRLQRIEDKSRKSMESIYQHALQYEDFHTDPNK